MTYRHALYYAPAAGSALWRLGSRWLGRDAANEAIEEESAGGVPRARLRQVTESARRYGFHATLKAPMRLASGTSAAQLADALHGFAQGQAPVPIGRLVVREIEGFLALVPENQSEALTLFAQAVVERFDAFRARLSEAELAKRTGGHLSARQAELLARFGYPYVAEQFRFHMTLTDRLEAGERAELLEAARTWFAPMLTESVMLDRIALFVEAAPGAPFSRVRDFTLGGPRS